MAPLVLLTRQWHIPPGAMIVQTARGIIGHCHSMFFAALQRLPMAEAISIYFCSTTDPDRHIGTVVRRKIRQRRIITILIGLAGVWSSCNQALLSLACQRYFR